MKALKDMNLPKFVFEDVPLFEGLITDLCPGIKMEDEGVKEDKQSSESVLSIRTAAEKVLREMSMEILPDQVLKVC